MSRDKVKLQTALARKLGFWLQVDSVASQYDAKTFFNAMHATSPYPAFLEMMIIAKKADGYYWMKQGQTWMDQLATLADAYPSIEIACMVGWDDTTDSNGWTALGNFINMTKKHSSITMVGVEGEYWKGTLSDRQSFQSMVQAAGKKFVSYYGTPSPYMEIFHTNFPGGNPPGDFEQVLDWELVSRNLGISNGYYATFPFPDPTPVPTNPTTRTIQGWSQQVVNVSLAHAVKNAIAYRQYISFCVGFAPASFTGVSGKSTTQLWDNPQLRSWIASNANYIANFTQSGTVPPPPTTAILQVSTTPVTGEVFVDGVDKGAAPQSITLPLGLHIVSFGAVAGYATPASQNINLNQNMTINGTYTVIPKTYTLTINSAPIAGNVTIDGVAKGATPVTTTLYSGTHTVVLGA
jgi:hypothetical protein